MVPRLEVLSGIQVAILHALDFSSKVEKEDVNYFAANPTSLSSKPECVKIQSTWYNLFEKRIANSLLEFPTLVRSKIPMSLVVLFIRDIIRWIQFHIQTFDLMSEFCFRFLKLGFFFTPKGINKELAARELINNTELNIHVRFCLACHYCFDENIHVLWRQIPDSEKPRFHENKFHCDLKIYLKSKMVYFCCSLLLKQTQEGDIFPMMKFWAPFDLGSEVSLKNCWQKLSMEERRSAIQLSVDVFSEYRIIQPFSIDVLVYSDLLDTVKWLLFDVNSEDFFEFYDKYLLLYYFLNWPYQKYFIKSLHHVWSKLSKSGFYMLLHRIVLLMRHQFSCSLYDYRNIFSEFWKNSPKSFKRVVFDHESSDSFYLYIYHIPDSSELRTCGYEDLRFKHLLLISELFNPESYSEDDLCIIQLLLESSTKEEKSGIVTLQGEFICVKAMSVGDLRIADLFIECCLPKENSESYKRTLVHSPKARLALWKFILVGNFSLFEEIVNWAINSDEEIKAFKENFILYPVKVHLYTIDEMKCIDRYLGWVFAPDKIKDIKHNIAPDLTVLMEEFKPFLLEGNFKKINNFLQWSFSSENEILRYKKDLASKTICNWNCFDPCKRLGEINRLMKWCVLSQEERKDLKHQYAFKYFVCEAYHDILFEFKFNRIDTFIRWSELSEDDVKQLKKRLALYSSKGYALINEHLAKGKHELVDKFFSWTQLSSEDVNKFKEIMGRNLNLEKYFFVLKLKFEDIGRVFNYIQLPEEKKKIIKENFALKSDGIIRCINQRKWYEVEEFVNWCFTSRKDCNWFKNEVFSSKGRGITWGFIYFKKFNDLDVFLNWGEIHEKEEFLKKTLYKDDYFQVVGEVLVNSAKKFESILDLMSGWKSLTEEWKESFLAFLRKSAEKKMCSNCNCNFHLMEVSCPSCSKLKLFSKDIMKYSKIISKHMNREEKVTNPKRSVNEIHVKSELRKSKRIKCKI